MLKKRLVIAAGVCALLGAAIVTTSASGAPTPHAGTTQVPRMIFGSSGNFSTTGVVGIGSVLPFQCELVGVGDAIGSTPCPTLLGGHAGTAPFQLTETPIPMAGKIYYFTITTTNPAVAGEQIVFTIRLCSTITACHPGNGGFTHATCSPKPGSYTCSWTANSANPPVSFQKWAPAGGANNPVQTAAGNLGLIDVVLSRGCNSTCPNGTYNPGEVTWSVAYGGGGVGGGRGGGGGRAPRSTSRRRLRCRKGTWSRRRSEAERLHRVGTLRIVHPLPTFDCDGLFHALDTERQKRQLGWYELADELWDQSAVLNAQRSDHPLCGGAIQRLETRGAVSCQYALFMLRWLGRAPEEFLVGRLVDVGSTKLPKAGPDRRLRWDLSELHGALNQQRADEQLTWSELAQEVGSTQSRLTNLRHGKFTDMDLAMRLTQWLAEPAASFIHPARW